MGLTKIMAKDLTTLSWIDIPAAELERVGWAAPRAGWWRIVAEMVCSSCGACQAADSDPTNDKEAATTLALRLFNDAGWRVAEQTGAAVCADCAGR